MQEFHTGLKLYEIARRRAKNLRLAYSGMGMVELIRRIQEREGYTSCFRRQSACEQVSCCWQAACHTEMVPVQDEAICFLERQAP